MFRFSCTNPFSGPAYLPVLYCQPLSPLLQSPPDPRLRSSPFNVNPLKRKVKGKPRLRLRHEWRHIRYDWDMNVRSNKDEAPGEDPKNTRFTIRPGKRNDAADAARLWIQSAKEHTVYDLVYTTALDAEKVMRRFLADLSSSGHSCLFVAEREGKVIGFLSGELREGSLAFEPKTWAAIEDIYVAPDYRNSGVGRTLFEQFQKWAKEKSAHGVSLQVAAGNTRARKLYEELGFREVSVYQVKEF
jgi:ribosomal protein S18 acetylase RimI-like enzyme